MASIWAWARLDVGRRWRSLVVLFLLTTVSAAVVLSAAAGAHRGGTAVDRLLAVTLPADVFILPNQQGFDWAPVAQLPYVEALTKLAITDPIVPVGNYDPGVVGYPPLDDELLRTIEKPVVLEGRVYDPTRADEVVVTPEFVRHYGKGVGDSLTMALAAPDQVADDPEPADQLRGPRVPVVIVGVIRTPYYYDLPGRPGLLLVSPALAAAHPESIVGTADKVGQQTVVNAQARLTHGAADLPRLRRDLQRISGRGDIDVVDLVAKDRVGKHTSAFEAACLWVLAGIALLASLFLVGQALTRHIASSAGELGTAQALGMAPRQVLLGATTAPVLCLLAGLAAALGISVVASQFFPIGVANAVEPDPGIDVDVPVLGVGALAILIPLVVASFASAWAALRTTAETRAVRRSRVAALVSSSRLPVPIVIGTRFALEPGRGPTAVPVRPAIAGAVIGIIGVAGVISFEAAITDALDHPERVGQTEQALAFHAFAGIEYDPQGKLIAAVRDLDYVEQVLDAQAQVATDPAGSTSMTLFSHDGKFPAIVLHGRMPEALDEVTLAPDTLDSLGAHIGDTVTLKGSRRTRPLSVVGEALVPEPGVINAYSDGGWVTRAGFESLFADTAFKVLLIRVDPAARTSDLPDRMLHDVGKTLPELVDQGLTFDPPDLADIHATLHRTRALPRALGLFLALLASGALGHALALMVRRRSRDLAVLRALGMTPAQSRLMVATQATTTMLIGIAFGIPLGVAFGRTLWRAVARYTPLEYVPPTAVGSLLILLAGALILANVLAAIPARRAARVAVCTILRTE